VIADPWREHAVSAADVIVLFASTALIDGLGWFFFAPRKARTAEVRGGVQRLEVVVRGGYRPDVIRVLQGVPVELVFDRQESGDCTSRVVFGDFALSAALPAFARTTVRLDPVRAGSFGFACGMNMVHGTLIVDPADEPATPAGAPTTASKRRNRRLPPRWSWQRPTSRPRRRRSGGPRSRI
jgi:Cu+-exporting ATPase